jgi:hypothetical protein
MLLIVSTPSYLNEAGDDWAQISGLIKEDWRIALVQQDHRFPDFTFVVLENHQVREAARKTRTSAQQ